MVLMFEMKSKGLIPRCSGCLGGSVRDATTRMLLLKPPALLSSGQTRVIIHGLHAGLWEMPTTPALTPTFALQPVSSGIQPI